MPGVRLPDRFLGLKEEQQAAAIVALQQVDAPLRQAVLDEWADRCRGSTIRNPAGYLFGIIQRAIRGEFNAWAKQADLASFSRTSSHAAKLVLSQITGGRKPLAECKRWRLYQPSIQSTMSSLACARVS